MFSDLWSEIKQMKSFLPTEDKRILTLVFCWDWVQAARARLGEQSKDIFPGKGSQLSNPTRQGRPAVWFVVWELERDALPKHPSKTCVELPVFKGISCLNIKKYPWQPCQNNAGRIVLKISVPYFCTFFVTLKASWYLTQWLALGAMPKCWCVDESLIVSDKGTF